MPIKKKRNDVIREGFDFSVELRIQWGKLCHLMCMVFDKDYVLIDPTTGGYDFYTPVPEAAATETQSIFTPMWPTKVLAPMCSLTILQ